MKFADTYRSFDEFITKNVNAVNNRKPPPWRRIVQELYPRRRRLPLPASLETLLLREKGIVHRDFRTVELEPETVDLVLTDPPEPRTNRYRFLDFTRTRAGSQGEQ